MGAEAFLNQEYFVAIGLARWQRFDTLVTSLEGGEGGAAAAGFPRQYRQLCQDLALARQRSFSTTLVEHLNGLVLRGHRQLYRAERGSRQRFARFWTSTFPRAVRAEWRLVVLSLLLFYGAGALVGLAVTLEPDLVYLFASPGQVAQLEMMYDPSSDHFLRPRAGADDFAMFGFYIYNNVGISFRMFAGGFFAGVGSLFMLLLNGVFLGAVTGHLTNVGFGVTFFPFVIGHGSFELTAIVFSAAAGLRLGWSLVSPGRSRRIDALKVASLRALPLVYGSAGMLVVAAVLEAFWSGNVVVGASIKLLVGACLWAGVIAWLLLGGRAR